MATLNDFSCFKYGDEIDKPPCFDGFDYSYWLIRIRVYMLSIDYDLLENG